MINNHVPPRFTFPGLAPSTTYYVKVWNNTDDTVSDVLEVNTQSSVVENVNVVTQNAQAGDLILFENFADLIYSGELSSRGMGISRTDRSNLTEVAVALCRAKITIMLCRAEQRWVCSIRLKDLSMILV